MHLNLNIPQESKIVKHDNVIAPGMFRINPFKPSREEKYVPNKVRASVRTNPITVSQPHVVTKKDVNSDSNGFSPKDIRSTTRTRRPKPWNNPKSDKVPFKSKSGCLSNKLEKIEENHRSLQSSHYPNHTSSECNNIKLATCKQCLITANHDDCVLQWSPTGRLFDLKGKLIASSESESPSDYSKGCQNWFDTLLTPLLSEYNLEDKEDHRDNECDT
ncbi:hypothetical protein Tco_1064025 [Tanacetum coccineum]